MKNTVVLLGLVLILFYPFIVSAQVEDFSVQLTFSGLIDLVEDPESTQLWVLLPNATNPVAVKYILGYGPQAPHEPRLYYPRSARQDSSNIDFEPAERCNGLEHYGQVDIENKLIMLKYNNDGVFLADRAPVVMDPMYRSLTRSAQLRFLTSTSLLDDLLEDPYPANSATFPRITTRLKLVSGIFFTESVWRKSDGTAKPLFFADPQTGAKIDSMPALARTFRNDFIVTSGNLRIEIRDLNDKNATPRYLDLESSTHELRLWLDNSVVPPNCASGEGMHFVTHFLLREPGDLVVPSDAGGISSDPQCSPADNFGSGRD